jgi:mannobiose 2-epimerase
MDRPTRNGVLSITLATLLAPAVLAEPLQPARPAAAAVPTADELDAYLTRHVLAPRFPACVDREHGGFHANFATDWTRQPDRHRFIVYQARNTWNAATVALARPASRDEYLGYTRHGVAFLRDRMWDREHGGFHDAVALDGTPETAGGGTKMTYGQAFAVYALALAHRATGDSGSLELARRAYEWVETHCRQRGGPGYLSGVQRDGSPIRVDEDAVAPGREVAGMGVPALYLDMNTSIHVLEAWTELLKEWPDPGLRARTQGLFELLRDSFYSEPGTLHLYLDRTGHPVAGPSSFGHDVETGFLLLEAAEALGIPGDPRTQRVARRLVDHALALGWNGESGQLYEEGFALRPAFDRSVQWWAQFELVNALSLMDALHGRETPRYREALAKAWAFTRERLTDERQGGVFGGVDEHGRPVPTKSNDWFAGYHTTRALLLTSDRLRRPAR